LGPIALFDKSFLQSISLDEAVWFDRFFMPVVCPIFYVETLGNLAKEPRPDGTPEEIVKRIAMKFPEMGGHSCGFHGHIATADLLGNTPPMDGRIPRPGGRVVKSGTVYENTPEQEAFDRWQEGRFDDVEKIAAAEWRKSLSEADLKKMANELRALGIGRKTCKTLEDAHDLARDTVGGTDKPHTRLAAAMLAFGVKPQLHAQVAERWKRSGARTLPEFAPYAAYALTVETFFQIALAAGLIAAERVSNRTDVLYLHYLPFCHVFISSDKLHRRCAPLFLRPDQRFVWGQELKEGLNGINLHFLGLPENEREKGIMSFANAPPMGNIVADIWAPYMRKPESVGIKMSAEAERELVKRMKAFTAQPTIRPQERSSDEDKMISIKRMIRKNRGSWWQLPKDLPADADKD
jgi:hypothetical protein